MPKRVFQMLTICLSVMFLSMMASAQQKFSVSINSQQEVPVRPSNGHGSCLITLNSTETAITVNCTYSGVTSAVVAAHIHDAGPVGVNGPVRFNFNYAGGVNGTIGPLTFNVTPAQVADLRSGKWYVNIHTSNFTGGEIRGQVKIASTPVDFDGDGRTDIRVFRSGSSNFFTLNSLTNTIFSNSFAGDATIGTASDDYDGDGRGDLVTLNFNNTAYFWRILLTATNTVREVQWGLTTDRVLPADYDGDGRTDIAVYRPSNGVWYIIRSSDNQTQGEVFGGLPNDIAVVGDFDKDGKNDLTIVRNSANGFAWFTRRSSDSIVQVVYWGGNQSGTVGDGIRINVQIDIDGDGRQDHMIIRDANSSTAGNQMTFFIRRSSDGQPFVLQWGLDTDVQYFGDYDGDGKTDIASRRDVGGQLIWYIYQSSNGQGRAVNFGGTGDTRFAEPEDLTIESREIPTF